MKVYCDNCKSEFVIDKKARNLENGIEEHYFNCPNCDKEYIAFRTNSETREIQKKLQDEIEECKKVASKGNIQAAKKKWNRVLKLRKKHKKAMAKIN
ncbi:transglycosylase [Tepidibacter hydrothermalis]|uniref:Transglycosylase n=1 Tax=Tepidibacter hydrothermalis TaxID=3036126 RepID=A0ABY8EGC4_9FIRM|nr:transglycosylase [Tepidibacter hydrothermalis]WFD12005.1 transglycosylase [Tepidibacter hydrothermalis]